MSEAPLRRFEDFEVGEEIDLGHRTVDHDEIVRFAAKWDPQPMHLDEAAGRASLGGGLIASGWHTAALFMRMACDTVLLRSASLGSPGIERLVWKAPLRPGDTLSARMRITDARASASRPDLGFLGCDVVMTNQRGEVVVTMTTTLMMGRGRTA